MILLRIILLPFVLILAISSVIYKTIKFCYRFVRYGGEMLSYGEGEQKLISDIYELLKKEYDVKNKLI